GSGGGAGGNAGPRNRDGVGEEVVDDTDERADRGLTADDAAAAAREDAEAPSESPVRPRIGDTRPAPVPQAASGDRDGAARTGRRRRRRGGRGRGGGEARSTEPVRADLGTGADGTSALEVLDEEVLERRRGRTRKGRPAGRYQMCVHVSSGGATQIAVLEGRSLVEHSVSVPSDADTSIDGNIYLGKVQNVLPGMEAAFVDVGTPKNGVLYRGDVAFDPADVEESQPRIERLLKNGQSITVQVTKNPIGAKGARLTQEVSLAGRFVVMVPAEPETYGISKRMPEDERRRLRRILDGIRPKDAGIIVRTAAEGATADELERDLARLQSQWQQISSLAASSKAPRLLYQEPVLVLRLIREEFTKEYRGVVIDDRALYEEVKGYIEAIAPELAERVEYYDAEAENLPLFERYHVQEQLLKALDRKVWLPSGGSLVIDRAEAFTVIDVNTGKNVGKSNLEETVFKNNLEAAEEVARQLRLRDIGGIIVIDFIDMEIKENRTELMRSFRDALARDKTRTQVFEVSELGLVEMTRKRISEGLVEAFSHVCETCHGRGYLVDISLEGDID
ncbi:MAG: Rne/Rng family ribonuclease, partial [Acidimicrobiia bacterium]